MIISLRLANLLRDSIRKFKVDSIKLVLCEDEECATAFHIDIKLPNDNMTLVNRNVAQDSILVLGDSM
jgi:hypothetical protein